MRIYILLPVVFSVFLQSCFMIGTKTEIIDSPKEAVVPAANKVAQNLSFRAQQGPMDAEVYATIPPFILKTEQVPSADLFLQKDGGNPLNNTGTTGAIRLTPFGLKQTEYYGVFGTSAGDAYANSYLFCELIKQQIALDTGTQQPFSNPQKSSATYLGLNLLSPILSTHYLENGNPLISKSMKPYLYLQNGIGDVVMVGLITAGLLTSNSDARKDKISVGISIGLLWRLLTLLNLSDISDYNELAKTPYNLGIIRP